MLNIKILNIGLCLTNNVYFSTKGLPFQNGKDFLENWAIMI